jgi:hypothetical protein
MSLDLNRFKKYIVVEIKHHEDFSILCACSLSLRYLKKYIILPGDAIEHIITDIQFQYDKEEFYDLLDKNDNIHQIKILYFKYKFDVHEMRLYSRLHYIIIQQLTEEALLEEVLRSKKNISGLIEDKIRSFIYY